MDAIYRGDCSISEVPGAKLKMKRGQAAVLTRPFRGNVEDIPAFLTQNPILSSDIIIPSMILDDVEITWDGPEASAVLTFLGQPSNNANNPGDLQSDAKFQVRVATLGTDNPGDGLWNVTYYAPTVSYRYAIAAKLSDPQYQGFAESPSDITVMDFSFAPGNPNAVSTTNYQPTGKWQYDVFSVCTDFQRNQRGNIYNYIETWATILQPPNSSASTAKSFNVGGVLIPQSL